MTQSSDDKKNSLIEELVEQFIDAQMNGQNPHIDEFVKQYPDIEDALRRRLEKLNKVGQLFDCLMECDSKSGDTLDEHQLIGQKLGDFEILSLIGHGGMGAVFLARQISLERNVALKVIADVSGARKTIIERFTREAKILAKISHPNIVPIFEVGQEGPYSFFAMEYIAGASLAGILESIRTSAADKKASEVMMQCLNLKGEHHTGENAGGAEIDKEYIISISKVIVSIATALEYAHKIGILHRDVKPSNILIDSNGTAKLVDFGLAKSVEQASITVTGEFFGTPNYVSPEQIRKPDSVDCRSDVYSLAATFYECLTLRAPFEGETVNETLTKVVMKEAVPPRKYCSRLSNDFNTVLLHALEKSPIDRYQTAADFAGDIDSLLEFRPIIAKKPSITQRAYKTLRRNPSRIVIVGISILVLFLAFYISLTIFRQKQKALAQEYYSSGDAMMTQNNYIQAIDWYKKALDVWPDYKDAYSAAGLCCERLGRYADAVLFYKQAVVFNYGNISVLFGLARCYFETKEYTEASETYKKLIEVTPDNLVAYEKLTDCYLALGEKNTARATLEKSVQVAVKNDSELMEIAGLFEKVDDKPNAIKCCEKIIANNPSDTQACKFIARLYWDTKQYDKAVLTLEKVRKLEPEDYSTLARLGSYYHALGNHKAAIDILNESTKINSDPTVFSELADCYLAVFNRTLASDGYYLAAMQYSKLKNYDSAIENLKKSLQIKPNVAAYNELGFIYGNLKRFEEASEIFRQSVEIAVSDEDLYLSHRMLGLTYDQLKMPEKAIVEIEKAIKLKPDEPECYSSLALAFWGLGEHEKAISAFEQAILRNPSDPQLYRMIGSFYFETGMYQNAINSLKRCLALKPNDAEVLRYLGMSYVQNSNNDEAIKCLIESIVINPHDIITYNNLGFAYSNSGNYEEAIKNYKQAIMIDPNFALAHGNLGHAYYALKLYGQAVESYENACKLTDCNDHFLVAELAAAYADVGDFNKAIKNQQKAIAIVSNSEVVGIGINLSLVNGLPVIESILSDTSASKSGLAVNDTIKAVDGLNTNNILLEKVINKIKGQVGTTVTLTVKHVDQDNAVEVTVCRDRIATPIMAEYESRLEAYKAHKPWRK